MRELPIGLSKLSNVDGVIGNRNLKKRFVERLVSQVFFRTTNILDIYCGFKILTRSAISSKLTKGTFATALVDKTANFENVNVIVKPRSGTRLGNEILVKIKLLVGGIKGYFN